MRILAADEGNSAIKLTLFEDDEIVEESVEELRDFRKVKEFFTLRRADGAIVCSTATPPGQWKEIAEKNWLILDRSVNLPIIIEYSTPETLGLDRIALAVGAARLFPERNILTADLGTALTLDVSLAGRFKGGNISPGLSLRFKSLHQGAAFLPSVDINGDIPDFGYDTLTAIRSGVVKGVIYEILGSYAEARKDYSCDLLLLAGRAMEDLTDRIKKHALKSGINDDIVYMPMLLAYGLLSIYEYNNAKNL